MGLQELREKYQNAKAKYHKSLSNADKKAYQDAGFQYRTEKLENRASNAERKARIAQNEKEAKEYSKISFKIRSQITRLRDPNETKEHYQKRQETMKHLKKMAKSTN